VAAGAAQQLVGSLHDLRRTCGTRLSQVLPIHVLKEYVGHPKIQTSQEYYLAAET
jgi:integrase